MSSQQTSPQEQEGAGAQAAPGARQLELQAVKMTDVGRTRSHNEDYVDSYVPPDPRQLERKGAIYLVADGMGGHQAGEVASQGAVELVIGQYYSDTTHDVGTSLVRAFRAANQLIYDQAQADPSKAGMGTTLVAAVILGREVYLANVGDSRAYLINKVGIEQITDDHSWVEEQVRAGLLTPEQAIGHPQRNLLTRALGTKPKVEVDLFKGDLGEGDMLLLCSDGLTGRVEDREIAALVAEHPPDEAARLLVALANERGGHDNITVLIVGERDETPTVAAPVPAPIRKQPTREFPWIPILAGVAVVLVLVLGGLLMAPLLFGRTSTPVPTVTTLTPVVTVTLATEPTETEAVTQAPVETPSSEGTLVPGEPTATLAATFTPLPPTPRPTQPLPTATQRPPTATPEAGDQPPVLDEPLAGVVLRGKTTFKWSYPPFSRQKAFQVLMWQEGETQHLGASEFTTRREQEIDLDGVPQLATGGAGVYYWSVVVVDRDTQRRLSPEAAPRRFTYPGPQPQGGDREKPPTPTPRP